MGWTDWEGNSWNNYKTMLGLLGSLGPSISAVIITYILNGKSDVKNLLKRVFQWRVNYVWWLLSIYSWWIMCSILAVLLQVSDLQKVTFSLLISIINIPAMIFILQLPLMIGMFGEEVGWRGFALPRLLEKHNPIIASIIIALPWIFWHTPLAVFQDWRGNSTLFEFFKNYFLLVIPLSIIFTWFFQKTKGSLLLIILLHKSFNLTFNAYKVALGLTEKSSEILRQWSIVTLWGVAFIIAFYYYYLIYNKEYLPASKKVKKYVTR